MLTLAPADPPAAVEEAAAGRDGDVDGSVFSAPEPAADSEQDAEPEPDAGPEREAWRTLLDLYLPVLEQALPCEDGRDPLAPPCPLDLRGRALRRGGGAGAGAPERGRGRVRARRPGGAAAVPVVAAGQERAALRLILVNDGSDAATTRFLRAFADRHPAVTLIQREQPPHGYTLAANRGLDASRQRLRGAAQQRHRPLRRLARSADRPRRGPPRGGDPWAALQRRHPPVGAAGQARWQRVGRQPAARLAHGRRDGLAACERGAPRTDTRLPFLNGFCYAIKREVIEAIGPLRRGALSRRGYCEENDYSQRARQAGFELAVVDDVYVHHAKSRSYGPDGRAELARRNYESFLEKHGRERDRRARRRAGGRRAASSPVRGGGGRSM